MPFFAGLTTTPVARVLYQKESGIDSRLDCGSDCRQTVWEGMCFTAYMLSHARAVASGVVGPVSTGPLFGAPKISAGAGAHHHSSTVKLST